MTEPDRPAKWHESLAQTIQLLLLVVLFTSPCWALVLLVWVRG